MQKKKVQNCTGAYGKNSVLKQEEIKSFYFTILIEDPLHSLKSKGNESRRHFKVLKLCPLHVTGNGNRCALYVSQSPAFSHRDDVLVRL
jgi:hypothetical protein